MQIVIDIPEKTYLRIQALDSNNYFEHDICGFSMRRIANGTPLPKGHGKLIDADEMKTMKNIQSANFNAVELIRLWIDNQQTIIEADKEQKE